MSFKTSLIKLAIKLTPDIMVIWVANIILKGIAELSDFDFDIDTRTTYVKITLLGEAEPIEVLLDGFAIAISGDSYELTLEKAKSNRLWLNNIFSRIVGKAWKIPVIPQYKAQMELVAELFKPEITEQEGGD